MSRSRPIGLFGGAFNPPHRGHLLAASEALRRLKLARVIFVPAGVPPHKARHDLAPARDRLRMVRLAVARHAGLGASDLEIRRRRVSFTIDTVRAFRRRLPGRELVFIVGADSVREIPTWHRWRELLASTRFAVVARPGHRLAALRGHADRFTLLKVMGVDCSASRLRGRLRRGLAVGRALPPAVRRYIRRRGLYRGT